MFSHLSWIETFYQVSQYQSGGTPGSDFGRDEKLYHQWQPVTGSRSQARQKSGAHLERHF